MPNTSIPRNTKQANLSWGQTFVAVVAAAPATYMIDPATVTDLQTLIAAYQDAFDLAGVNSRFAVDPSGYTKPNRAALSTAASEFNGLAAQLAVQIQANNAISDADKLAAGIVPRNFIRTPVPAPSTPPVLAITLATNGVHQIEFADITTPTSRRKPTGVMQIQLLAQIHDVGTPEVFADALLVGQFTKSPMLVTHDPTDNGKLASYWGRWVTRTGLAGPFSAAATGTIMFA